MLCQRRRETGALPGSVFDVGNIPESDMVDGRCGYCGSADGDVVLAMVEAGTIEFGPTDKGYKAYLSGALVDPSGYFHGYDGDGTHLPGERHQLPNRTTKFYFQHWTREQHQRFIELLNAGRVRFGYPGYFYRRPYFIAP